MAEPKACEAPSTEFRAVTFDIDMFMSPPDPSDIEALAAHSGCLTRLSAVLDCENSFRGIEYEVMRLVLLEAAVRARLGARHGDELIAVLNLRVGGGA